MTTSNAEEAPIIRGRHRIDVHHHFFPEIYKQEAREGILQASSDFPQLFEWTPRRALDALDGNGFAAAVLSISTPGIWFGGRDQGRRLARTCNECAARMVQDFPGRFGSFAALPLPDVDGSLKEIEFALGTLKADGIGLMSSYGDRWLGDPAFAPVFNELNRRKAVVFVHPSVAPCCAGIELLPGIPNGLLELFFDTMRTITSLLYSGTFSRNPDIRFIFCHGGGALAQMAERMSNLGHSAIFAPRVPNGVMYEIKKLYLDVVRMTGAAGFNAVRELVGIQNMLLGSDFPYSPVGGTSENLARLNLSAADLQAIERDNALKLLPRLSNCSAQQSGI